MKRKNVSTPAETTKTPTPPVDELDAKLKLYTLKHKFEFAREMFPKAYNRAGIFKTLIEETLVAIDGLANIK